MIPYLIPPTVHSMIAEVDRKRQALEHAQNNFLAKIEALDNAKSEARRANEALAEAEQELTMARGSVTFTEQRLARAGLDLLSALKEANLFPVPSVTCPTVGEESDHDHAKS